jgi:hypothetical protein
MRYFLPDSQDLVDPSFDFRTEKRARTRLRQRDDLYAHEVFSTPAFDGLLVSKGIVDGFGSTGSRYTLAQRQRLLRSGARAFFRSERPDGSRVPVMGDCGAFTYVKEELPPYSVDEVISFYSDCGFDYGISVDHVILAYDRDLDGADVPEDFRRRQAITLELAAKFRRTVHRLRRPFEEVGVAQGWSPKSYATAVRELQKMGYEYIAVGGMVPLKTTEILEIMRAVSAVREPKTRLHLLGVTRTDSIPEFERLGAASLDSTSPLRQAFKDDKDNYYTLDRTYVAIRIPQVEGNPSLQRGVASGRISQNEARRLEKAALGAMDDFARDRRQLEPTLDVLLEYERLYDPKANHEAEYRETLGARPWEHCQCDICRKIGHHVILFRGAERNRRRGFHNVWTFYRRLQRVLPAPSATNSTQKGRRHSAATGAEP